MADLGWRKVEEESPDNIHRATSLGSTARFLLALRDAHPLRKGTWGKCDEEATGYICVEAVIGSPSLSRFRR
jgi:hypothetical protein